MSSYTTDRKKMMLAESLGNDWEDQIGNKSIDKAYKELTGDTRKNIFCKVSPEAKAHLDVLKKSYKMDIGTLLENLINREFEMFTANEKKMLEKILSNFSEMD